MNQIPAQFERIATAWPKDTRPCLAGDVCPEAGQVFDAVTLAAGVRQRREIIAHTARCGACAETWRLAVALRKAMPVSSPGPAIRSPWHALPAAWGAAMAMALALAVGIVALRPAFDPGVPPPAASGVVRGVEQWPVILDPADGAHLPAAAFHLSWQAPADALAYQVDIADAALNLVYNAETSDTALTVPADAFRDVADGSELHWYVIAILSDGREARSATNSLILNQTQLREKTP